ncbi:MAG: hypothetical protein EON56_06235 [Alphaproteobacteria bacterium]|nr:MAG: hypothetical protein EON56_06235 [Alphaproteobacteria bacterium]
MTNRVKTFEVLDSIDIDGITLKAGHYMGMASWSSRLSEGREEHGPRSYYIQLTRKSFQSMGGVMADDRPLHEIDVTHLMQEGLIR